MFIVSMLLVIFLAYAEIDIIVTSLPELQQTLQLSTFAVELLLSFNVVAHLISALYVGKLSDRFGRRFILLIGFLVFMLGCLVSIASNNFYMILFGRIIQGAGSAPMAVLPLVMVLHYYPKEKQNHALGLLNGISVMVLFIAPILGTYVSYAFGWRGNFGLMIFLAMLAVTLIFISTPADKPSRVNVVISQTGSLLAVLKNKQTMLYMATLCAMTVVYYTIAALTPLLYIKSLGVALKNFGYYHGALALSFGVVSSCSGLLLRYLGYRICFIASAVLALIFIAFSTYIILESVTNPLLITASFIPWQIAIVFPYNALFIRMLATIPGNEGSISGVNTAAKWISCAAWIQVTSYFYQGSYNVLGLSIIFGAVLSLLLSGVITRIWVLSQNAANQVKC